MVGGTANDQFSTWELKWHTKSIVNFQFTSNFAVCHDGNALDESIKVL